MFFLPITRYKRRDFERLFSGGYGNLPDFVGTQTVATNHTLPEVYGSVRAYYDSMSLDPKDRAMGEMHGKFRLHVRLINPDDGAGYPRWIELPRTKAQYARINENHPMWSMYRSRFWDDAYTTAWDSVRCWNPTPIPNHPDPPNCGASVPGYAITDIPDNSYSLERRKRHKVVYLYSGATFTCIQGPRLPTEILPACCIRRRISVLWPLQVVILTWATAT